MTVFAGGILRMDCLHSGRQIPTSHRGAFERLGTDLTQMAVSSRSIIKDLDVIEDIGTGELTGFVDTFADSFLFQATEEGFGHCIDAPMSRTMRGYFQIGNKKWIQLPNEIAF